MVRRAALGRRSQLSLRGGEEGHPGETDSALRGGEEGRPGETNSALRGGEEGRGGEMVGWVRAASVGGSESRGHEHPQGDGCLTPLEVT